MDVVDRVSQVKAVSALRSASQVSHPGAVQWTLLPHLSSTIFAIGIVSQELHPKIASEPIEC